MPINPSKLLSDHFNPTETDIGATTELPNSLHLGKMDKVNKDPNHPLQNTVNPGKHVDPGAGPSLQC